MSEETKTNDVTFSNVEEKEIVKANGGAALFGIIFCQLLSIALVIVSGLIVDKTIELPMDEDLFYSLLQDKIKNSTLKKTVVEQVEQDMSSTF